MKFTADAKYETALLDSLLYIDANLGGDLTLDLLARRVGFSPYHFHRVFTRAIGEGVKQYIRRLRLEHAAYRLKISNIQLLALALESGYKTHETFTRAFAKQFGINPGQFRINHMHLAGAAGPTPSAHQRSHKSNRKPRDPDVIPPPTVTHGAPRLENTRPIIVAFIRHHGIYDGALEPGSKLGDYWQELFRWGAATQLVNADSLLIGIPQDDPTVTPADKTRFDIGVQVSAFHRPMGNIGCQTIAGGLYGVARHYGPFTTLAETYRAVYEAYVATAEYQMRLAPPFEVYGHTRVRDDLEIHYTDVYLPLEPLAEPPQKKRPRLRKRSDKPALSSSKERNNHGKL